MVMATSVLVMEEVTRVTAVMSAAEDVMEQEAAGATADKPPLHWAEASQSSSLGLVDREATVGDAGFAERSEVATRVAPRVVAEGTEVEVIVVKEKEGKEVEVIVVKEKEGTEVEAIVVKEKEVVPQVMVGVWVVELEDTKVELEVMAGAAVAMADKPPLYWAEASQSSSLDRADREATVGDAGFAERSVCTFERCVDSTYSAGSTDGSNTPPARRAFGSVTTRDAPNTAANSYKLRPLTWSPSTS
ncbi:hypothetical protein AB1Y20_017615 [Prymnesium parvum]|uniref:Uncharacterized protein n=1 Tax=Prymnesium parvum TaxID=97485 RepID=A0AB34JM43_PRYPA